MKALLALLILIGFAMSQDAFPEYLKEMKRKSEIHGTLAEIGVPYKANTMRNVPILGSAKVTPKRDFILEFPLMKIESPFEVIVAAKLKIFWQPRGPGLKRSKGSFKMTVLDLINKAKNKKLPMDSKTIFSRDPELDSGFYEFDILPSVVRWSKAIVSSDKSQKGRSTISLLVELSGLKVRLPNKEVVELKPLGNITEATSLLLYTHDKRHQIIKKTKREAKRPRNSKRKRKKGKKNSVCGLHRQFVNFTDIGWDSWVISPKGYEMNFCQGVCPFPMADHMNATNNAIFQQFYHRMNPDGVPAPCCIPTEYEPLTILQTEVNESGENTISLKEASAEASHQDRSTVMVKVYNDMSAKSCGCR